MKQYEYRFCPYCGSQLVRKRAEGERRQVCSECGYIQFINPTPVVAIVISHQNEILFVKRKYKPAIHRWALPGGFIDGIEHPEKAAARELEEETNLKTNQLKLIGLYTHESKVHGPILMIGYQAISYSGNLKPGDDAEDLQFFSHSHLPDIPFVSHKAIVKKYLNSMR